MKHLNDFPKEIEITELKDLQYQLLNISLVIRTISLFKVRI